MQQYEKGDNRAKRDNKVKRGTPFDGVPLFTFDGVPLLPHFTPNGVPLFYPYILSMASPFIAGPITSFGYARLP
jgi:hypothetical protein